MEPVAEIGNPYRLVVNVLVYPVIWLILVLFCSSIGAGIMYGGLEFCVFMFDQDPDDDAIGLIYITITCITVSFTTLVMICTSFSLIVITLGYIISINLYIRGPCFEDTKKFIQCGNYDIMGDETDE